jgi:hypothetical protein
MYEARKQLVPKPTPQMLNAAEIFAADCLGCLHLHGDHLARGSLKNCIDFVAVAITVVVEVNWFVGPIEQITVILRVHGPRTGDAPAGTSQR